MAAIATRIAAFSAERDALPATAKRETRIIETGLTLAEEYAAAETIAERRVLLSGVFLGIRIARGRRGVKGFDDSRVDPVWSPQGVALRIAATQQEEGDWVGEPLISGSAYA